MHLILSTDARERVLLRSFCKVEARKENTFTPVRLCVGGRGVAHTHAQRLKAVGCLTGNRKPIIKNNSPNPKHNFSTFKKKKSCIIVQLPQKGSRRGGISGVSLALLLGRCSFCPLGTPFPSHLSPWHTGQHHAHC